MFHYSLNIRVPLDYFSISVMSFPLYSRRLKLNHPLLLNLHPDTFHWQATKVAGGRHPGITASVSPGICALPSSNWPIFFNYRQ